MYCKKCGAKSKNNLCQDCLKKNKQSIKKEGKIYNLLFSGRIGRLRYFVYIMLFSFIFSIPLAITKEIFGIEVMFTAFNFVIFAPLIALVPITAKRLRDLNLSGYLSIPISIFGLLGGVSLSFMWLNFLISFVLLFKKGTEGENDYGPLIKKNSKLIIWTTFGILGLFVFSMIVFTIISLFFI